jgi:hypothetical protein
MTKESFTDQGGIAASAPSRNAKAEAKKIRKLMDGYEEGEIVAIAATVKYADGSVRYVPIGAAPDPLDGLAGWLSR